jgi:Transposase DDE domain
MLRTVTLCAAALQTLLFAKAEEAARVVGLVRRRRRLGGAQWVRTLVFGWMRQPDATLEDLADEAARLGAAITPQGLDAWFGPEAAECLKRLTREAVGVLLGTEAAAIPLLRRFTRVSVEDCTVVALPACLAEAYPGCGGNDAEGRDRAALKAYVRMDLKDGAVTDVAFLSGKQPDVTAGQEAAPLPAGSLRLKDLGFFDLGMAARDGRAGVHWVSRLPSGVTLREGDRPAESIAAFLERQVRDEVDVWVRVGGEGPLTCRLMAVRCPEAVRQRRLRKLGERARKKGRPVSARQRVPCGWTVLITDLPAEGLTFDEAWVLYRARWQIELLFKLWKGRGGLARSRGRRGDRVLCEVLAKLLAMLVQHWLLLTADPWLDGRAATRKVRRLRRLLSELVAALDDHTALEAVLRRIREELHRLRPRNRREKKPGTIELLNEPGRARLGLT